jgi:hypothetical protein
MRADAVAEFRFGMVPNIDFYLFPISLVIANLFTGGTYQIRRNGKKMFFLQQKYFPLFTGAF